MRKTAGENVAIGAFIGFWALVLLANLAVWGVIVWAIISLVTHYT
jgi:hypothetical protein